jgi:nucleotide-binding universal stress UspA family protein
MGGPAGGTDRCATVDVIHAWDMPATFGMAPVMLVPGCRGHGGFVGALLGSVSQHCVQHATCPVVVIRGPHH